MTPPHHPSLPAIPSLKEPAIGCLSPSPLNGVPLKFQHRDSAGQGRPAVIVFRCGSYGCVAQALRGPTDKRPVLLLKVRPEEAIEANLNLFDIILISESELLADDEVCQRRVTSFTRPTTGTKSMGSPTQQRRIIAGVAQIDRPLENRQQLTDVIYVVGVGIPTATPIQMPREINGIRVRVHDFICLEIARLPDGFEPFVVGGLVIFFYDGPYPSLPISIPEPDSLSEPHRIMCLDMRLLSREELAHVHTHCAGVEGRLPLEQARLLIRDPWVARGRLEEDVARQEALRMSLTNHPFSLFKEEHPSGANRGRKIMIELDLDEKETRRVISGPDSESKLSWRVGDELLFRCDQPRERGGACLTAVGKTKTVSLIIDRIDYLNTERLGSNGKLIVERRSRVVLDASATKQSREFFSLLEKTGQSLEGARCTIGPQAVTIYSSAQAVEEGFFQFYNGSLFEEWRGSEVAKRRSQYDTKLTTAGGLSLDNSQLSALRSVAGVSGFSCISAPPGSGKTLLISALVAARNPRNSPYLLPTSFAVTAATNTAVTAAMEAIAFNSPGLKICREFSKRAKFEANKKSLRDMSLSPYDYVKKGSSHGLDEAYQAMLDAKEQLDAPVCLALELEHDVSASARSALLETFEEGRRRLEDYNDAERRLRNVFVSVYKPHAICTTPVLLSRRTYPITHLVIDEAARMSSLEALAIYCRQPNLTHVTLLGDDKQICQKSDLPRSSTWDDYDQSHAYLLTTTGEMPRAMGCRLMRTRGKEETVSNPRPSTNISQLYSMYRHIHSFVANWLLPIYGSDKYMGSKNMLQPPPTANTTLKLAARDGCPCLLVDLPYREPCPAEREERRKREKDLSEEDRKRLEQLRDWEQETSKGKKKEKDGKRVPVPRVCEREVDLAIEIIEQLKVMGLEGEDVAILCHHRSTKELLLIKLKGNGTVGGLRLPVDVSTVAAYQGKTAKAVIILTTSTSAPRAMSQRHPHLSIQDCMDKKFGLVANKRMACVALSRSLGLLYIVGDWKYLLQTSFWGSYRKLIQESGAMVDESFEYISPNTSCY